MVLVETEKISYSLCGSSWYNQDKLFRTDLNIFLGYVNNPIIVSAGGLFELSAVTFKNVINVCSFVYFLYSN